MDNLVIETPEQIPLEFPLAGIGSRVLALALDTYFQIAAGAVLVGVASSMGLRGLQKPTRGAWTAALIVLLLFLLQFGYFAIFEAIWNGQTPGPCLSCPRPLRLSYTRIPTYHKLVTTISRRE